jgi:hypothetical protein
MRKVGVILVNSEWVVDGMREDVQRNVRSH